MHVVQVCFKSFLLISFIKSFFIYYYCYYISFLPAKVAANSTDKAYLCLCFVCANQEPRIFFECWGLTSDSKLGGGEAENTFSPLVFIISKKVCMCVCVWGGGGGEAEPPPAPLFLEFRSICPIQNQRKVLPMKGKVRSILTNFFPGYSVEW